MNRLFRKALTYRVGSILLEITAFTVLTGQFWIGSFLTVVGQALSFVWYLCHERVWGLIPTREAQEAAGNLILRRLYEKWFDAQKENKPNVSFDSGCFKREPTSEKGLVKQKCSRLAPPFLYQTNSYYRARMRKAERHKIPTVVQLSESMFEKIQQAIRSNMCQTNSDVFSTIRRGVTIKREAAKH